MRIQATRLLLTLAAVPLALAGCTSTSGDQADGRLTVLASIYPLRYVVEQVGGDAVTVTTVTPAGADPHSVELSPRQLRTFSEADVVVYLSGFQPAVDDAVAQRQPEHLLDAAASADLRPLPAGAAGDNVDGDQPGEVLDPHFWLDPTRLSNVVQDVARVLSEADPDNADGYVDRAAQLRDELAVLDAELTAGLADCERDTVVTSHAAFGYLTDPHGLRQVGVSGIDPEGEPSPARLREVRDVIAELGVTTVFTEPLADPAVAASLAEGLGVDVGELDPLDSHGDGPDYREVMQSNLAALRAGLGCA